MRLRGGALGGAARLVAVGFEDLHYGRTTNCGETVDRSKPPDEWLRRNFLQAAGLHGGGGENNNM